MIGDLYNVDNVVVGQAAVLIAPQNTPLPSLATADVTDPFSADPWTSKTLTLSSGAAAFTITVGDENSSALTGASTPAQIQAALQAMPNVGVGEVSVTGVAPGPYTVAFSEVVTSNFSVSVNATSGTAVFTGGLWVPVGATDQGWKFVANKTVQDIDIEEQSTPANQSIPKQAVQIDGSLSEDISSTIALAFNATLARVAAVSGQPGYDDIVFSDSVLYYAVALITSTATGLPRWTYAPKWSQISNSSVDFRRATAKRMYPVSFTTICKPQDIRIVNFREPALP